MDSQTKALRDAGYDVKHEIAQTLQGRIVSATRRADGAQVVIKQTAIDLHSQSVAWRDGKMFRVNENILKEYEILRYLTCQSGHDPGMVKFIDLVKSDTHIFLVMQHGGFSLFDFCVRAHKLIRKGVLSVSEWHRVVRVIFKQMVDCVAFLHSNNVCHFDISLENFLINDVDIELSDQHSSSKMHAHALRFIANGEKGISVKLCDFGLSEWFGAHASNFGSNKYCGKMSYQSPEISMRYPTFDARKNDIFGLGVCFFTLVVGSPPWNSTHVSDVAFAYFFGKGDICELLEQWKSTHLINADIVELFQSFFQFERTRITMPELKKNQWLNAK
eukprot:CAMPEP_0202690506 /NCGR_PEP_ID=MMETSP1385-20130828/5463_1 /ASSEMBLY_ACC=CAM_ASM_000861 /TAXON_ID=933848 /ORGANISM="Elphidium margaritaceum" /LENGTH=330 /DNA_ID=CAMNT_0049345773 /DNA_START=21 /DNA_END=1013 /DNA_ORIENTATION=-